MLPVPDSIKINLLAFYDQNQKEKFFKLWRENLCIEACEKVSSLECLLYVYFATAPLKRAPPNLKDYQQELKFLVPFLESKAKSNNFCDTDVIKYIALGNISKPHKHPGYKDIFQPLWQKTLKTRLSKALNDSNVITYRKIPLTSSLSTEASIAEQMVDNEYSELKQDYKLLYKSVNDLMENLQITSASVFPKVNNSASYKDALKKVQSVLNEADQKIKKENATFKKTSKSPDQDIGTVINNYLEKATLRPITKAKVRRESLTRKKPPLALKKNYSSGALMNDDNKQTHTDNIYAKQPLIKPLVLRLNYAKIVNHIIKNPSSRSSALLLQALRQQITRTPTKDVAVETIKLFANKDILLLKVKKNSILSNVMINHEGNNMEVREEIARFINAIASFQVGRSYLVKIYHGQDFIYQLVNGLKSRRINGHSADHAISALQKLSVKSNAQKELFQNGMIDWLVVELHNIRQSKTFIEFGTALLLNLCLVSSSQSAILRVNCEITSLMSSLLELRNSHLNVYIYHLLFVIFQFRKVRQNSIENGFLEILEKQKNGILSYQEQCVLTFLECCLNEEFDYVGKKIFYTNEDEDNWEDYAEAEIDSTDTLVPTMTDIFGEHLLASKYRLSDNQSGLATDDINERFTEAKDEFEIESVPRVVPVVRKQITNFVKKNHKNVLPHGMKHGDKRHADSMMSYMTFILDNDKRKPLLLPTGLMRYMSESNKLVSKKITNANSSSGSDSRSQSESNSHSEILDIEALIIQEKSNLRAEEFPIIQKRAEPPKAKSRPRPITILPKTKLVSPDKSKNTTPLHHDLEEDRLILPRIDDTDYSAVFGARPKVLRTPDDVNLNHQRLG